MVKAVNIETPPTGEKKAKPVKAKPLLENKELLAVFGSVNKQIAEFEEISVNIKVADNDSLSVAENHSSRIQEMLNSIELARVTLKSPYLETGKAIDAYAKNMKDPLDRSKVRINSQITAYKELAAAQERLRIDKEQKERVEKDLKKAVEIEKLARIKKQLYARIYGGIYYLKDDTRKTSLGCQNIGDCDNLIQFVEERFPNVDSFTYLKVELEDARTAGMKHLVEHKANLVSLSSTDPDAREKAMHAINEAKTNAEVEAIEEVESLKHTMEKESKSEARQDEKDLKHAKKGVRENVKFVVEDGSIVPVDFKVVSDLLVNNYISGNKLRIKEALREGKQLIPGLLFYVDSKFVTSG